MQKKNRIETFILAAFVTKSVTLKKPVNNKVFTSRM